MKVAAVVLAGGQGRRIGGNKPLRMLGGISLLDRAVAYARGLTSLCAVAVREDEQAGNIEVARIRDDAEVEGPLGGLVAALRFARDEGAGAALTIPADMPFLPPDLGERLLQELVRNRAAIASSDGHLHPVCGAWSIGALDMLPGYLATVERSLKGFAARVGFAAVEWPSEPFDPFFNINSEQDLARAEHLLASRRSRR